MRHQAETEQMTRLLLQKPAACAELEENSRIAITVLTETGWKVSQVGMDMLVKITATAPIQELDAADQVNAKLVAHVADAELRLVALQQKFDTLTMQRGGQLLIATGLGLVLCEFVALVGLAKWIFIPGVVLIGIAGWMNSRRMKGVA